SEARPPGHVDVTPAGRCAPSAAWGSSRARPSRGSVAVPGTLATPQARDHDPEDHELVEQERDHVGAEQPRRLEGGHAVRVEQKRGPGAAELLRNLREDPGLLIS